MQSSVPEHAQSHPFQRSGLAQLSDLATQEWQASFLQLETHQAQFLSKESEFRSADYKWPRDPLHTWSRLWEYPYAYHHLERLRTEWREDRAPRIVDLGSGVTFFPFSLARLGYRVTCADIDPVCVTDIPRAARAVTATPGSVDACLIQGDRLPFADGEIDALYCISVLEHIPNPEQTLSEISRILKPGGLFILTIDLDLRGDSEIGVGPHRKLVPAIETCFEYECHDATVHPANVLASDNGPLRWPYESGLSGALLRAKQMVKWLLGRTHHPLLPFRLAVQAFALSKRVEA
jgi:SAM-dependent methyltransferase